MRDLIELLFLNRRLTKLGQKQLEHETEHWQRVAIAMANALAT